MNGTTWDEMAAPQMTLQERYATVRDKLAAVTAERDALKAEIVRLRGVIRSVDECITLFNHTAVYDLKGDLLAILDEQPDSKRCDVQPYGPDTRCNLTRGHEGAHETSAPIFTAMGLDEPEFPTIRKDNE